MISGGLYLFPAGNRSYGDHWTTLAFQFYSFTGVTSQRSSVRRIPSSVQGKYSYACRTRCCIASLMRSRSWWPARTLPSRSHANAFRVWAPSFSDLAARRLVKWLTFHLIILKSMTNPSLSRGNPCGVILPLRIPTTFSLVHMYGRIPLTSFFTPGTAVPHLEVAQHQWDRTLVEEHLAQTFLPEILASSYLLCIRIGCLAKHCTLVQLLFTP